MVAAAGFAVDGCLLKAGSKFHCRTCFEWLFRNLEPDGSMISQTFPWLVALVERVEEVGLLVVVVGLQIS